MTGRSLAVRLLVASILAAVAGVVPGAAAQGTETDCPAPAITDVLAYQPWAGADWLLSEVVPGLPWTAGWLTKVDGSEQRWLGADGDSALPLGTQSDEWYLSSLTVLDETGACTRTWAFPPTAPYLLKVVNLTQIRSTSPEQYVAYGEWITVSGVLEGWADAAGWQPLPGRDLTVVRQAFDPDPLSLTIDQDGAYTATIQAIHTDVAGSASFARDDSWRRSFSWSGVQVHARVYAQVSDPTPVVRQSVKITGKVVPGAMPVWLERWQDDAWNRVTPTVMTDAEGRYTLRYRPDSAGIHRLRVFADGTNPETREGVLPYWKELSITAHR